MSAVKIRVDRYKATKQATLSRVYVDGEFVCFGLEDEQRAVKVRGETRIPAGEYRITLRAEGGFHQRYKADRRFDDIHIGMLWIRDVPSFEYILIHAGNTHLDTNGCLLVGAQADEIRMTLSQSGDAYRRLYLKVRTAAEHHNLTIVIEDNDQ